MAARCRKFVPNLFNKSKCQSCFGSKEHHSAEALEGSKAARKISKCAYLFVAPDLDFNNPLHKSKRWQRRFFVLYDDGELTYAVDNIATTVPQGSVDMNKCTDVFDAEERTGHEFAIGITAPPQPTLFVKGVDKDEIRRWFDVLVMFPRSLTLTVKTKRVPPKPGGGGSLAVTGKYGSSAGHGSDDENKENSIISSSLDGDAYDRLSRSRAKPKVRDYRRSKSEVRPSDLKLAGDELDAAAAPQPKELAAMVLAADVRPPTGPVPPAHTAAAKPAPSATAAGRQVEGSTTQHPPAPAGPVYNRPPSPASFAARPPAGAAPTSTEKPAAAHPSGPWLPAAAVAASGALPPKPPIKEPLMAKKVEPETYSSVRSLKHKKLAAGPAGGSNAGGRSSAVPLANGLARSTSMQDVSVGGGSSSGGLAVADGDRDVDIGSRDDLSLLRPSKATAAAATSVVVNGGGEQSGLGDSAPPHQHKAKTLYESLMHPEPAAAAASHAVKHSATAAAHSASSKEKWLGGGVTAYQQLASVPKLRQPVAADAAGHGALSAAAATIAASTAATAAAVSNAGLSGTRMAAAATGRPVLVRSSTPVNADHDGTADRPDASHANETDEHKIAKSEQQSKKLPAEKAVPIRKGWLTKQEANKELVKHWFVLSGTSLAYYKDAKSEETNQVDGMIDIATCYDVSVVNMDRNNSFKVRTRSGDYLLSAMTSGIRRNWMDDIEKIMVDIKKAEEKNVKQNMGFVFVPPLRPVRSGGSSAQQSSDTDSAPPPTASDRTGRSQRSDSVSTDASVDNELSAINSSSHFREVSGSSSHDLMDGSPTARGEPGFAAASVVRSLRSAGRSSRTSPSQRLKERSRSKTPPRVRSPPPPPISYDESPTTAATATPPLLSAVQPQPVVQQHQLSGFMPAVPAATLPAANLLPTGVHTTEVRSVGAHTALAPSSAPLASSMPAYRAAAAAPSAQPPLPAEASRPTVSVSSSFQQELVEKCERLESELKAKTDKLAVLEKKAEQVRRLEEECGSRSAKLVTLENLLSNTRRHLDDAMERNRELELQQRSRVDELESELDAERAEHAAAVSRLEERLERFLNQSNIADSLNSSMADVLREKNSAIEQLESVVAELELKTSGDAARDDDLRRLSSENDVLKQRLHVLQHRLEQLERECQELRLQCGSTQASADTLAKQCKVKDKQVSSMQQEVAGLRALCASLEAECQLLRQHRCPAVPAGSEQQQLLPAGETKAAAAAAAASSAAPLQRRSRAESQSEGAAPSRAVERQSWHAGSGTTQQQPQAELSNQPTESHLATLAHWQAALTRIVSSASACTLGAVMAASGESKGPLLQMNGSFARTLSQAQRSAIGEKLVAAVDEELSSLSRQLGDMVRAHADSVARSLATERDVLLAKVAQLESARKAAAESAGAQAARWQAAVGLCRAELARLQECLVKSGQRDGGGHQQSSFEAREMLGLAAAAFSAALRHAESASVAGGPPAAAPAASSSPGSALALADPDLAALCERLGLQAAVMYELLSASPVSDAADASTVARRRRSLSSEQPSRDEQEAALRSYCALLSERLLVADSLERVLTQIQLADAPSSGASSSTAGGGGFVEPALALEAAYRLHIDGRLLLPAAADAVQAPACLHGQLTLVQELCRRAETPAVLLEELEQLAAQRRTASDDLADLLDEHCLRRSAELAAARWAGGDGQAASAARLSSIVRSLLLALMPRLIEQTALDGTLEAAAGSGGGVAESLVQNVIKALMVAREGAKSGGSGSLGPELESALSQQALTEARMVLCLRQLGACRWHSQQQPPLPSLSPGEKAALAAEASRYRRASQALGAAGAAGNGASSVEQQRAAALAARLADVDSALELRHSALGRLPRVLVMREAVFAAQLAVARWRCQQTAGASPQASPQLTAARAEIDSLKSALREARAELAALLTKPSAELQVQSLQEEMKAMRERHALELEESKKDMRMVLKSVAASEQHRLESDLAGEVTLLKQQLATERALQLANLEAAKVEAAGHSVQELEAQRQQQLVLKDRVRELERCLHEMQEDFEEELYEERQAHVQELDAIRQERLDFLKHCESGGLSADQLKAAYEKEIEKLRAEQRSLQQWIDDIREAHKDEIEALQHEKEVMLADESSAAQAALDSLQRANEARLAEVRLASEKMHEMAAIATAELERKIKIYLLEIESRDKEIASLQEKEQQYRRHSDRLESTQTHCVDCVDAWRQTIAEALSSLTSQTDGYSQKSIHDVLQTLSDAAVDLASTLSPVSQVPRQRRTDRNERRGSLKVQDVAASLGTEQRPQVEGLAQQPASAESTALSQRRVDTGQKSVGEGSRAVGSTSTRLRRMTHDGSQGLLGQMSQLQPASKDQALLPDNSRQRQQAPSSAYGLNRCKSTPMISSSGSSLWPQRQLSSEHLASSSGSLHRTPVTLLHDLQQFNMSGGRSLADRLKKFERT